jgi:hypothetical protein|eukprot:COSAG06_NODE_925_length_11515_cov_2815.680448_4_plen_80_part_00
MTGSRMISCVIGQRQSFRRWSDDSSVRESSSSTLSCANSATALVNGQQTHERLANVRERHTQHRNELQACLAQRLGLIV